MARGSWVLLWALSVRAMILSTDAETLPEEVVSLHGLAAKWGSTKPQSWVGEDPCGSAWLGITCKNSHVIEISLSGVGLNGTLSGDLQGLTELQDLDLSLNRGLTGVIPSSIGTLVKLKFLTLVDCNFIGNIPPELGNIPRIAFISLSSNKLQGPLPASLGNLSKLIWLDITGNEISGQIPVSDGTSPGLDNLTSCNHFHFGGNKLTGSIPPSLFHSGMRLIHVLFDNNCLTGEIPATLGLVTTLQALRLDNNNLSGKVPSNLNSLTNIQELHLSTNKLTGPLPNLTGMNDLTYVDLSNNTFDMPYVPTWFSTLPALTSLVLEHLKIAGQLPSTLFTLPALKTLKLQDNLFNGSLDLGIVANGELQLLDLRRNDIQTVSATGYNGQLLLADNPCCSGPGGNNAYCKTAVQTDTTPYSTPVHCSKSCPSDQDQGPTCHCSYPFVGTIHFRLTSFSDYQNQTHYVILEREINDSLVENHIPVDSFTVSNPHMDEEGYLDVDLKFFPSDNSHFNDSVIIDLTHLFLNDSFQPPPGFGTFFFTGLPYDSIQAAPPPKADNLCAIVSGTVGGAVLLAVVLGLIILACRQKKKADKAASELGSLSIPFGSWDTRSKSSTGSIPPVLRSPIMFTFEEIKRFTSSFSEENEIGAGGYGKVYRATLPDGQLAAVKRAQKDSIQGALEFKTEIEMLSRVHHSNLVSLIGFCSDQGEQILVYEYFQNGNLRESLTGKSVICLDWRRRLRVALGAARGLTYLHELASPPIVHRDIKSNNILLDYHLTAKVSDFGLCKQLDDDRKGYITTQVKGTMGYLDPEYYMTQQLTKKSDVYSFGALLLELITARKPIERGRYVVREIKNAIDKSKELYGLHDLLDPILQGTPLLGFDRFVDLAVRCVAESSLDRPSMSEVGKEIEGIMQLVGMSPHAGSASASGSFVGSSRGHPYSNESIFNYSGKAPSPK